MEYHKTKKLVHVRQKLGHKSITTTILTHTIDFDADTSIQKLLKMLKK